MFTTIINDCRDENAMARQATRASVLLESNISTLGIKNDLEAAGCAIDVLDAAEGKETIILMNVAPRHGKAKKWPNGTPFGYFYYKKTLVISTIDGYCLSLIKKFNLIDSLHLLDIPTVVKAMIQENHLDSHLHDQIIYTQFRSYDFVPRAAHWITQGLTLPATVYALENILDMPPAIWWVDNFGNCKTTLLPRDIGHEPGKKVTIGSHEFMCYSRLKDVPNGQPGLIIGSSGFGQERFLEIVIQGKSASNIYNIHSGDILFEAKN